MNLPNRGTERKGRDARAGLILLSAEWFDNVIASGELVKQVASDAKTITAFIREVPGVHLSGAWQVHSDESLAACCQNLRQTQLDMVILVFQVWAEDWYIKPLLEALGELPLVIWCYQPWQRPPRPAAFIQVLRGSGLVGTLEGMGTLRNLDKPYFFTYGSPGEARLIQDLSVFSRACAARSLLQRSRIGLLPGRNEQMQSTFVDETRLRTQIGPQVKLLSVGELKRQSESVPQDEIKSLIEHESQVCQVEGVGADSFEAAARASLGLVGLAEQYHLDAMCLNDIDPELHRVMGVRPTLFSPRWSSAGGFPVMEGDLGAATAGIILQSFSGGPLLLCEFWFWDEGENILVGGHAGLQNPACAEEGSVFLFEDAEYRQSDPLPGAHYHFIARAGRVTLLQLRCTLSGWQGILATGESLGGELRISEGYPHAAVRLDRPLEDFFRRSAQVGTTQHFMLAFGDYQAEVKVLFDLLKIPLEII
jgi:hypothetical protein